MYINNCVIYIQSVFHYVIMIYPKIRDDPKLSTIYNGNTVCVIWMNFL